LNVNQYVLRLRDRWLTGDGRSFIASDTPPRLRENARVLCSPPGIVSGSMAVKGPSTHAGALVERRLRADGLIDGDSRVLVHYQQRAGDVQQVLYSAFPLEVWQSLQTWTAEQDEHALLYTTAGLLWRALGGDGVAVLWTGRELEAVARVGARPAHAVSVAFSDDSGDHQAAAAALAEHLAQQLPGRNLRLPLQVYTLEAAPGPIPMPALLSTAFGGTAPAVRPLSLLLDQASALAAINPSAARLAYLAERTLPWAAAASLGGAVALGVLAGNWLTHSMGLRTDLAEMARTERLLQQELPELRAAGTAPPGLASTLAFLQQAHASADALYPQAALAAVRTAALGEVRILRVRSDDTAPRGALQIEGRVADGRDQGVRLAVFVERLRQAGYEPRAMEQGGGNRTLPTGFFAYQLLPLTAEGAAR
jgi:hypothetical protein